MRLYFRGVPYEYHDYYLSQREVAPQSVQMLRYRGVPHMRSNLSFCPGQTSAEVAPSPNDRMQLDVGQEECVVQPQRMGLFYKLYCVGWRNGSRPCLPLFQHRLLSTFRYYRTGYTDGFQWRRHSLESQQLRE